MHVDGMVVARTPLQLAAARLRHDYVALCSLLFIALLVVFALAGSLFESWTNHPLNKSNSSGVDDYTLLPVGPLGGCPNGLASVGEPNCFVLGASNSLGYDMLVQLSYGARTSLRAPRKAGKASTSRGRGAPGASRYAGARVAPPPSSSSLKGRRVGSSGTAWSAASTGR